MTSICIFCGSNEGLNPAYKQATLELVDFLVKQHISLVFGGNRSGLMQVFADRALQQGGRVTGVTPKAMAERGIAYKNLTELHVTEDLHERKKRMSQLSDAFIALPGGFGTMDELFQELTLALSGTHNKVCGLLNTEHYYDHLVSFIEHGAENGLMPPHWQDALIVEPTPELLITRLLRAIK